MVGGLVSAAFDAYGPQWECKCAVILDKPHGPPVLATTETAVQPIYTDTHWAYLVSKTSPLRKEVFLLDTWPSASMDREAEAAIAKYKQAPKELHRIAVARQRGVWECGPLGAYLFRAILFLTADELKRHLLELPETSVLISETKRQWLNASAYYNGEKVITPEVVNLVDDDVSMQLPQLAVPPGVVAECTLHTDGDRGEEANEVTDVAKHAFHAETAAAALAPATVSDVDTVAHQSEPRKRDTTDKPDHVLGIQPVFLALIADTPLRDCEAVECLREKGFYKSSKNVEARIMSGKFMPLEKKLAKGEVPLVRLVCTANCKYLFLKKGDFMDVEVLALRRFENFVDIFAHYCQRLLPPHVNGMKRNMSYTMESGPLLLHQIYFFAAPKPWPFRGEMSAQPVGMELGKIVAKHAAAAEADASQLPTVRKRKHAVASTVDNQNGVSKPAAAKKARGITRFSTKQLAAKLGSEAPENAGRQVLLDKLAELL